MLTFPTPGTKQRPAYIIDSSVADIGQVISDELITVGTTPITLTVPEGAALARIEVRCHLYVAEFTEPDLNVLLSESVRFTLTGDAPSAGKGYDLEHLDNVWLSDEYLAGFRAVRGDENTEDGTLYVTYFGQSSA